MACREQTFRGGEVDREAAALQVDTRRPGIVSDWGRLHYHLAGAEILPGVRQMLLDPVPIANLELDENMWPN